MIEFLFLDLDDTILDFHKAERIAISKTIAQFGLEPTEEVLHRYHLLRLRYPRYRWFLLGSCYQPGLHGRCYRRRYRSFHLPEHTAALIISQSGETADTLACLREIKRRGAKVLGIVNVIGSTIAREVDGGTYVYAGPEISVASTKAFTAQVTTMLIFAGMLAESHGGNMDTVRQLAKELVKHTYREGWELPPMPEE